MADALKLFDFYKPNKTAATNKYLINAFQITIAALVLVMVIVMIVMLNRVVSPPTPPIGSSVVPDYNASALSRKPLGPSSNPASLMALKTIADTTPMLNFQIATANFGGVFTTNRFMDPWIGEVNATAATLQIEAGARAMTLDIWPDPADSSKPVVVCMMDMVNYGIQANWTGSWGGLGRGVGRYSNWNAVTRNKLPVGEVVSAITKAAFTGLQSGDPFFLIFKLHGAMTKDYLNTLGSIVGPLLSGTAMSSAYNKCNNQAAAAAAPVSDFMGKCCVIVVPDFQTAFQALPGVVDTQTFNTQFLATKMGELTNFLEMNPNPIFFDPLSVAALQQRSITTSTAKTVTPPQAGFCLLQPPIGGPSTDNATLFSTNSFPTCMNTKAQFVAVNLFDQADSDPTLTSFFDPGQYFGTYSFIYNKPLLQ